MSCRNVVPANVINHSFKTAYLLDEVCPEYDDYISSKLKKDDKVFLPFSSTFLKKNNYAWCDSIVKNAITFPIRTLKWARRLRKLSQQGPLRQEALLKRDQDLAQAYSKKLSPDVNHCLVMQNFLPHLWKTGMLGGRTFEVFMTRLPIRLLHQELDKAAALFPGNFTLKDFRADSELGAVEWEALQEAQSIITPHRQIAAIFPEKTILLEWEFPSILEGMIWKKGSKLVFPALTAARKGAYWVREIVRELQCELVIVGGIIEDNDFWKGLPVTRLTWSDAWWKDAGLLILPAVVEFKPRALLLAQALKIPMVISEACGLKPSEGVHVFPSGSWDSFRELVQKYFSSS